MTIEEKLKQCIKDNYGTVKEFCDTYDIPTSTISTIFRRGIMSSSTTTMLKICENLGIDIDSLIDGEIVHISKQKDTKETELLLFVNALETADDVFTYKQHALSDAERKMIAFTLKVALEQL
jgi:hypothetical protein